MVAVVEHDLGQVLPGVDQIHHVQQRHGYGADALVYEFLYTGERRAGDQHARHETGHDHRDDLGALPQHLPVAADEHRVEEPASLKSRELLVLQHYLALIGGLQLLLRRVREQSFVLIGSEYVSVFDGFVKEIKRHGSKNQRDCHDDDRSPCAEGYAEGGKYVGCRQRYEQGRHRDERIRRRGGQSPLSAEEQYLEQRHRRLEGGGQQRHQYQHIERHEYPFPVIEEAAQYQKDRHIPEECPAVFQSQLGQRVVPGVHAHQEHRIIGVEIAGHPAAVEHGAGQGQEKEYMDEHSVRLIRSSVREHGRSGKDQDCKVQELYSQCFEGGTYKRYDRTQFLEPAAGIGLVRDDVPYDRYLPQPVDEAVDAVREPQLYVLQNGVRHRLPP